MRRIYAITLALLLHVSTAYAQTCPTFPQRGVEIIDGFLAQSRYLTLAQGTDDQRRELTTLIAEQMRFELGNWSNKSADPGRPKSKDSLALPVNGGPAFCNWDWQNGSTRRRGIDAHSVGDYLADQNLLPTAAVNHLGVGAPDAPVVAVPDNGAAELRAQLATLSGAVVELRGIVASLTTRLAELQAQGAAATSDIAQHAADISRIDAYLATRHIAQTCKASIFGLPVSCRLE